MRAAWRPPSVHDAHAATAPCCQTSRWSRLFRLAVLVEHAATDGSLARKLQLALAAGAGEDSLVKALTQRVRELGRDDRFIEWSEASSFAREIDQLSATIVDDLAPRAPRMVADLLADLVHTSDVFFVKQKTAY